MFGGFGFGQGAKVGSFLPAAPPAAGYSLETRVSGLRTGPDAAYWTDTTDPFAPNGLELPAPPTITSTVTVSSLASLDTELASPNGKQITLTPGTYTRASGVGFAIANGAADCRVIISNCTINTSGTSHSFTIGWRTNRIEILCDGCSLTAIPEIQGNDIRVKGGGTASWVGDGLTANRAANGSGTGWQGHRVVVEGVYARGYDGLCFVGSQQGADFVCDISGTTLNVTTVYEGTIRLGQNLITNGGAAFTTKTRVGSQVSGTPGGVGVYNCTPSQTRASGRATAYEPSTNCITANCNLEVPYAIDGVGVENPFRFNGGNFCLGIDSRAWEPASAKHVIRSHGDYANEFPGITHAYINCQLENQGLYAAMWTAGLYPDVYTLILDGLKWYQPQSAGYSAGMGIDYDADINIAGLSGNGTTVTVTLEGLNHSNLADGTLVTINPATGLGIPSGFAATNVAITNTGPLTFTYSNTTTGTYGGAQGDYCGGMTTSAYKSHQLVRARNILRYNAPAGGTNGTGAMPVGNGVPTANWPMIADAATSLSNGNQNITYVSTPAWSFYTTTPT